MAIEICTVGGYNEVGKNMTAIRVDDEVVIIDMGLHLEPYIKYTDEEGDALKEISANTLTKIGAIPNLTPINHWLKKVVAVVPTHAHLDHVGAIPYLSNKFNADIICTPFTAEVIKAICKDEKIRLNNDIKVLNPNSAVKVTSKIKIELINITHSTPQTAMVAIHTPYGKIVYGNDFKFDNHPVLGKKPNYERLKKLGEEGVICLIVDGTRSGSPQKTPSEQVAKEMLRDVMLGCESEGKAVIVTTFSSHLARLQSIIEFGKKMGREVVLLGRSMGKYVAAGENIGIIKFSDKVDMATFRKHIAKKLKKISKNPGKYLIVCTGHQGEPKSVLSRMIDDQFEFSLGKGDQVIFSCTTIPTTVNYANREILEGKMKRKGVRIFKDIHVSGHAAKEDLRDLINMVKPDHIIPAHGDITMASSLSELAMEMDYRVGEDVHIMQNGQFLTID
ncbi:RNase J family beta-CASP ribonuclease [Candidatus Woesearchaeota archaeon]|nr:RNase J family beta-CASP ribonuclease [Candidatus Woesearchaeota archaeon]